MWQVLLAAAVAGSGLFLKRLHESNAPQPSQLTHQKSDQAKPTESSTKTQTPSPPLCQETIFRFSSASGSPDFGARKSRKKLDSGSRGIREKVKGIQHVGTQRIEKKSGLFKDGGEGTKIGKRFAVCLKKRRTSKNASAKCECSAPKDGSSFAWGLGVGLMYMMSTGKSEISRLNMAVDETAKVVQELKTEIAKRKSSRRDASSLRAEGNVDPKKSRSNESREDTRLYGFPVSNEGDCGSSVLSEELHPEVLMDQLGAELESELQKLPWCTTEASVPEKSSDFFEAEVSDEELNKLDNQNVNSFLHIGVMPAELDQKLCHVLLEQQESQIVELESELQQSHSKLNKKEAELQALKDCVRRLTKFSLASASDEETEAQANEEENADFVVHERMGAEKNKSMVGIKRALDYGSYSDTYCAE